MNRSIPQLLLLVLCGLVGARDAEAAAPQTAGAKLYAKVQGEDILVAIKVTPEFGCYFYDDGPGEVGGIPTSVEMGGLEGAEWTPVWFPEPKVKYDEKLDWTSKLFDKPTVLFAAAKGVGADANPEDVTAQITGQVCDASSCVPWEVSLSFRSAGTESVWSKMPADLLAMTVDSAALESEAGPSEADHGESQGPRWEPIFGEEKAMARAFARDVGDDQVELVIQVATPEHWHMYHGPTSEDMGPGIGKPTVITVEGGNVEWDEVSYPRPFQLIQTPGQKDAWLWAFEGTFYFGVKGEAFDEFDPGDVAINIQGQSCDESGCIPVSLAPAVEGQGEESMYSAAFAEWTLPALASAAGTDDATVGEPSGEEVEPKPTFGQQSTTEGGLVAFILLAISAGLFTLLMPCTYPMIPITISYFTKQAENRGGKVLSLALAYGAGIVAIFVLLGVVAGPFLQPIAGHWITNVVIGTIFVVFALALFGAINLNPPQFMMKFAGNASSKGGYFGVFLMGLTLVISSFTCTGPFVGSLLAAGSRSGGVAHIAMGMGAFGATMALPFVVLALIPGKLSAMPSAGAWMNTLKVFMGFVELAAALKFFSNADIAVHAMILPREVFLILWTGIAFVAGLYLLGRINLKGESPDGNIGPGRLMGAIVTILGGFYCLLGAMGYELDGTIMSAMAPPPSYSRGLVETHRPVVGAAVSQLPEGAKYEKGQAIVVVDDYDLALEIARERNLGLIVNFTAHT